MQSKERGEIERTMLNQNKSYRELVSQDPNLKKSHSALNVVRTITLQSKRGKIVTSDNL